MAEAGKKLSQPNASESKLSPRQKGIREGMVLILLSVILIPAYILLAALFPANDRLVESAVSDTPFEKIAQAVLFTLFMLGLARALYARLFQTAADLIQSDGENKIAELKSSPSKYELPTAQDIPASGFGSWRTNTGDVAQPPRAAEHAD